jgi:hypothetical protein
LSFWEFELTAEALHIGERIKKGTFRPLVPAFECGARQYRPLPYSTAVGSLKEYLGLKWDIPLHAAGYFTEGEEEELTIAPRDNVTGVAKLPITIQYLARARGKMFVLVDDRTRALPERFEMAMGGLRYKGLGLCRLTRASSKPIEPEKGEGLLLTRIPHEALAVFGIDPGQVKGDGPFRRGYLFKPTSMFGGVYVKSLFEGSKVKAFDFLLGEESWKAL